MLWVGVGVGVVIAVVVAVLLSRGGHSASNVTLTPQSTGASGLTAPLHIGDFVALCGTTPCSSPPATATGAPGNSVSQTYVRPSTNEGLLYEACDCGGLDAAQLVQRGDFRGQFGANPSVVTLNRSGTQYTCMTGAAPPGGRQAVSVCAWKAGSVVYALEGDPAIDPQALIVLASSPEAQAGASGR